LPAAGNLNVNPLFIDPNGADDIVGTEDDDLRIAGNSPAIDVGTGIPLHFQRTGTQWLTLRAGAEIAAFDEFYLGNAGSTGCLSGATSQAVIGLDGGTMTVTALNAAGSPVCAIIDGSTPSGQVSDARCPPRAPKCDCSSIHRSPRSTRSMGHSRSTPTVRCDCSTRVSRWVS
jgi:hypothetical protein